MLKEIHDSSETVKSATRGRVRPEKNLVRLGGLEAVREQLRETERVVIVACGTSYYAGLVGEKLIEEIAETPVEVQLASEFKYQDEPLDKDTAVIAVSQSGETADTTAALEKAKDLGLLTLGVVNAPASTISRITDAGVYCHAGPEISVASTKSFTSQVTVLAEIALSMAKKGNKLSHPVMQELADLPDKIDELLTDTSAIEAAAKKYARFSNFLFIGRGYDYINALEGALKLKEVSYIHAEGYGAGEMKHGPIALIDENFPTMAIANDSPQLDKTMSNIEEIKARKGPVIAIATTGNMDIKEVADDVIYLPKTLEQTQPILTGLALQLFAYHVAVEKGLNPDRPRNLAKSVTVE
jgi:glucosamine--fructose-6-phosphate aminotransferase (isomerizing)